MWAFFFPGQGSQNPGMGKWLFDEFKIARDTFEETSDALHINLIKMCFDGPEEDLQKTENAQPAILTTSMAYTRVITEMMPITPIFAAGHSVGEYAALVSSGCMSLDQAAIAVHKRGIAMQNAVPLGVGGMCAVLNLDNTEVQMFCEWCAKESRLGILEPANFNTPGQVVISGILATIQWAIENWSKYTGPGSEKKARFIPLKVSAPFHCSLMQPAEKQMAQVLNEIPFNSPRWPIVQNYNALPSIIPSDLKDNLVRQISGTVRWTESVKLMVNQGIAKGLELGHGQVLRGLNKKISPQLEMHSIQSLDELRIFEKQLKELD